MKIVQLVAENFKKLRAVEITPAGEVVTIAGRNGAGKSSTLDAIWATLAGADHIQAKPIRAGESKARIRLNLGDIIVERRITEKGSQLFVESAEGARYPSPQKMLDSLIGELSFDPLAFARMEPRRQFDELRRISKLEVDVEQLDALNKGDYAKRTDINRQAREKRAQAEGMVIAQDLPPQPIDTKVLLDDLQDAAEKNTLIERTRTKRMERHAEAKRISDGVGTKRERIKQLEAEIEALRTTCFKELADCDAILKELESAAPLPEPVDVASLRIKLEHANQVNAKIVLRNQRADLEQQAVGLEAKAADLTEQMEAREKAKQDAIAKANMPVPGLGFGDGVVTFNGVPFDQASSAEQLRVSVAIAAAANPKLRVILIRDGSLLDDDSMKLIAGMAKEQDFQVWIERVGSDSKVGVVIDDGSVVAIDGEPVASKAAA